MEQTYTQLEEDEERFRKLQTSDQANFNDRLDTLQVCTWQSSHYVEINDFDIRKYQLSEVLVIVRSNYVKLIILYKTIFQG